MAKLEALAFEWVLPSTDEAGWEAMRARLAAFEAEHGHCRVSAKNHPADPKLGGWVHAQRKAKKRLDAGDPKPKTTNERVAKLDALGFEWSLPTGGVTDEAGWEAMRARLVAFKTEHGHCRVPSKLPADPKLGGWVHTQRVYKKKLDASDSNPRITAERVAKLDALGFDWISPLAHTGGTGWEAMRARLAAFEAEHGHCRVPRGKHAADPKLSTWVATQRQRKKKLDAGDPSPRITAGRVTKLEALGFEWDARKRKR